MIYRYTVLSRIISHIIARNARFPLRAEHVVVCSPWKWSPLMVRWLGKLFFFRRNATILERIAESTQRIAAIRERKLSDLVAIIQRNNIQNYAMCVQAHLHLLDLDLFDGLRAAILSFFFYESLRGEVT